MTGRDDLERSLARWLEAEATGAPPPGRRDQAIETTRMQRPRPTFVAGVGSFWVGDGRVVVAAHVGWRIAAITVLLSLALTAAALYVGSQPRRFPAVVGPPNGLIAYSSDGDIYVGDPVTGQAMAIVTGTEVDSSPKFSPDGSRIAFLRGDYWGDDASIIVARANGSDERVAMPSGSKREVSFTWTPNGASLLVNHDSEPRVGTSYFAGELSLVDASGVAEARLLTPPLPRGPGGGYFSNSDQVAPMFQPPNGDVILSVSGGGSQIDRLYAWDADLERGKPLGEEALKPFEPILLQPWALWWSPDGSTIAFHLCGPRCEEIGFFLMNADGTNPRRLDGVEWGAKAWSPDGSKIAYQRGCPNPGRQGAVIVIHAVVSGAEDVLEGTEVETKYEGTLPSPAAAAGPCYGGWIVEGPEDRAWDYEGWSWSPDSRSIVMLERRGTRPIVVDVETGQATELPWEADSAPSWQSAPDRGIVASPGSSVPDE
jgi:dipeptidyl aminopeptidase/acylaminoacyl peptidase